MNTKSSVQGLILCLLLLTGGCENTSNPHKLGISVRAEPLRDFETNDTIMVSDYGAIPDDDIIDTRGIQEAIDAAKAKKTKVLILFKPGIYRLDAYGERNALKIDGLEDMIFDGNGASFMMVRPGILLLSITNGKRVIVRNFSVDYEISPFTQGWVTEVNPEQKWLKVEIDTSWPDPDQVQFRNADYRWAFIKDKDNLPAFKEGTEFRLYLDDWEHVEKNIWIYHIQYTSQLKCVEVGDPFVQISRVDGCLIEANSSEDITLLDLRLYQSPACMLGSSSTSRINYLDIIMSPSEGRWMSAGADGCFNVNGREGPWVEGCTFNSLGDDNLVIKGLGAYVIYVKNDSVFTLVQANHRFDYPPLPFDTYTKRDSTERWEVLPGDLLEIVDPLQGRIISEPYVTKTEKLPIGILVTIDRPIKGIQAGTSSDSSLIIFNQSNCLPRFVVKNNKFSNAPRFGFLLKSHDGIIENNHFVNNSEQSITMINTDQEIGGRCYNILIKGNKFEGTGGWPVRTAMTAMHSLARRDGLKDGRNILSVVSAAFILPRDQWDVLESRSVELRNIHIIDNVFYNWRQLPALTIMNAENVTIKNNRFIREKDFSIKDTLWLGKKPVRILYSRDVEIGPQEFVGDDFEDGEQYEIVSSENVVIK
jgi:hypothetical protein